MSHTPLPHVSKYEDYQGNFLIQVLGRFPTEEEADLIVAACNSHAALKKSHEELLEEANNAVPHMGCDSCKKKLQKAISQAESLEAKK